MSEAVFIGIDVSKDTLEVASSAQASSWQAVNDTAGIEAAPESRVGLAAGVLSAGRYVGSIIASVLLGLVVADDGDGVRTTLIVSAIALIASLLAAANFPGRVATSAGARSVAAVLPRRNPG